MKKDNSAPRITGWFPALKSVIALIAVIGLIFGAFGAEAPPRERLLLDFGWKFHLGDDWDTAEKLDKAGVSRGPAGRDYNDSAWRELNVPHDWAIELPFDPDADNKHGNKPIGPRFETNSVGWYRRTFSLPKEDRDKRLWIEFDGVYRDCLVFVNGHRLAHHEGGYNSFRCDITDVANNGGRNTLAVRVDVSKFEGWFYEGAGIYRHVWLVKHGPLAIAPDGVFVYSQFKNNVPQGPAQVQVETHLNNSQDAAADATVKWEVLAPDGKVVAAARQDAKLAARSETAVKQAASVATPVLWSPESPKLYRLVTTVESGGKVVDRTETEFGIRTFAFDPDKGFLLNGKPCVIKGTCNHQDHAGVGVAMPDALQYFRVARLKEMGGNAYRTSHNPPTPELLEACDRLGMLVMDESRLLSSDAENLRHLADHVRRDRNHASVFIWCLANEEIIQRTPPAAKITDTLQDLVHDLDPSRLCTVAMNSWSGGKADGVSTVIDVQGFNYLTRASMDGFHKSNPAKPCIGTEEASTFYARGVYENSKVYKSAYDDNKPGYGQTAEEWVKHYAARPWASGAFVWTGFDYRGEPSPFRWPNISSHFGLIDTCGFAKDIFYYYQAWWSDKTVLHLMPHWTWPGKEGQEIDVRCFSNCDEVELFLNDQSLGKQAVPKHSHLRWKVKYAPGMLSAKGFKGGKAVAEKNTETASAPASIKLAPDRPAIRADGEDLSIVTIAVTDAEGRVVPAASNLVNLELTGPGKIIGVGNGDPACHEPDVYLSKAANRARALDDWRMQSVPDVKDRPEVAEDFRDGRWTKVDVRADTGPIGPGESAIFRTRLSMTADDLAATNALLHVGMIDDDGWVYVNGRLVGESHNWDSSPAFEIRKFLHDGDNVIAIAIKNSDGDGGLNKGVTLELQDKPVASDWKRSVFNGLAQVIVQADKKPGEIKLTGRADGLAATTIVIRAGPSPARPTVP